MIKKLLGCVFVLALIVSLLVGSLSFAESTPKLVASNKDDAILLLRKQLVERCPGFTISLPYSSFSESEANALLSEALAHTGNPVEGDYLRYHLIDCIAEITCDDGSVSLHYAPAYKSTAVQEEAVNEAVKAFFDTYPVKDMENEYERAYAIYDYICDTVVYDYARKHGTKLFYGERDIEGILISNTAYAALVEGTAVCEGYATLFYRLALEAGLDARIVSGFAYEDHAWNIVRVDGKYYKLDATWDAGAFWDYEYFLTSELPDHKTTDTVMRGYDFSRTAYEKPEPEEFSEGDYTFTRTYGASIRSYNGEEQEVVVPATLGGMPVVSAQSSSFSSWSVESLTFPEGFRRLKDAIYMNSLKELFLPSTVSWSEDTNCPVHADQLERVMIDENNRYAQVIDGIVYSRNMRSVLFCPALLATETVTVAEGVEQIAHEAFMRCIKIKRVILPESITVISGFAFDKAASLEEINIPSHCISIGQWAFGYTAIKELSIPASVESIGGKIASYCSELEHITVEAGCENYFAEDDILYHRVYENKTELLRYPSGSGKTVFVLPEHVVYINDMSGSKHLEQVELDNGNLILIANQAFAGCSSLKEVTIPETVKDIWEMAFIDCRELDKITVLTDDTGLYFLSLGDPNTRMGYPVIAGHEGSTAQRFAMENGLTFEVIP